MLISHLPNHGQESLDFSLDDLAYRALYHAEMILSKEMDVYKKPEIIYDPDLRFFFGRSNKKLDVVN
jgi:hypothetical protein